MQSYFGHIFLPKEKDFQKIEGVRLFIDGDDFWIEASIKLYGVEKYDLIRGAFTGLGYVSLIECNVIGTSTGVGGPSATGSTAASNTGSVGGATPVAVAGAWHKYAIWKRVA